MEIGDLDRRIRIEAHDGTRDAGTGAPTKTGWATLATVWAKVEDVLPSQSESLSAAGLVISQRPVRIVIRYRADITSAMRVVDIDRSNRVLKIATQPAEIRDRKHWLQFYAVEFTTAGNAR